MNPVLDSFCPGCGGDLTQMYVEAEERERLVCSRCGHIHYLNPKIVAGTVPRDGDRIWLLRRGIEPRYGAWTFPAGFMEMGETVEECGIRETREELGMDVEVTALLGVYSQRGMHTVHVVYEARALTLPTGGSETLEYAPFTLDAIPWDDLAFNATFRALRDYVERHP